MVLIKSLSLGAGHLTINVGAEELFHPFDQDCPPPTYDGNCPDGSTPTSDGACENVPTSEAAPPADSTGPEGWYTEDCDDCCHPISDAVINYTEVVVAAFTSAGYTKNITCSDADVDRMVNDAVLAGAATVSKIDPKSHSAGKLSKTEVKTKSDGTQVYELDYAIDIPIEEDLNHLEVVTYMRVDLDRIKDDKQIDTSTNLQKNISDLMGTQASHEVVIELGKTRDTSYVYIESGTDKVWDGPVHNHPSKGLMAGPRHTMLPHSSLSTKRVPNIKIQNDNVKDEILSLDIGAEISKDPLAEIDESYSSSNKDQLLRSFISEPIPSRAPDGKTRFLFYIDHTRLVQSQSRYPSLKDPSIYSAAPIESLQVYRTRATDTYEQTELGITKVSDASKENQSLERELIVSTADSKNYSETPSMYESQVLDASSAGLRPSTRSIDEDLDGIAEKAIGSISEISVVNLTDKGLRVFSVEDSDISTFTGGKFGYSTEIEFQDPSTSYMNKKLSELCAVKDSLLDVSADISNLKAYDSVNKKIKKSYKNSNGSRHTSVVKEAISQIIDIISVTTGQIDKRAINYLMSISTIQAGSSAGVETLIEIVNAYEEKLNTLLEGNLDIDNSSSANIEKEVGILNASNSDSNLMAVEKPFNYLVDRSTPDSIGVDYVGAQIRSFPQLSTSEYLSSGTSASTAEPMEVSVGDVTMSVSPEMSTSEYQDITLRAATSMVFGQTAPIQSATPAAMAEDLLSTMGVSVSVASETNNDPDEIETFSSEAGTALAGDSFGTSDLDNETGELDCGEQSDAFIDSSIATIGTIVVEAAQVTGTLNADAPINQGQTSTCDNGDQGEVSVLQTTPSVIEGVAQVEVLQGHQTTQLTGPSLTSGQYGPLTNTIIDRIQPGQSVLARLNTESTVEGETLDLYTENFLITNGTQTSPQTSNMSQRKQRVTNYVEQAFERVVFDNPSQTVSSPQQSCQSEFKVWNVN